MSCNIVGGAKMQSGHKGASYAIVTVAGAYALIYVIFLRDMPQTHYDFRYATVLLYVAVPILLFALGNDLGGRLRPSGGADVPERGRRAWRWVVIVATMLYAALVLLVLGANAPGSPLGSEAFQVALDCVQYAVTYGGIVAGFLWGYCA